MREILFRGKRVDNGEWVEGYYAPIGEYHYILTGRVGFRTQPRILNLRNAARVHDLQVCQVPAKAIRSNQGDNRQKLYYQQLPYSRYRTGRRIHKALY